MDGPFIPPNQQLLNPPHPSREVCSLVCEIPFPTNAGIDVHIRFKYPVKPDRLQKNGDEMGQKNVCSMNKMLHRVISKKTRFRGQERMSEYQISVNIFMKKRRGLVTELILTIDIETAVSVRPTRLIL